MSHVTYKSRNTKVAWAYKVGACYSEVFRSKEQAFAAASEAAREHKTPGETGVIEYEDSSGLARRDFIWK